MDFTDLVDFCGHLQSFVFPIHVILELNNPNKYGVILKEYK